MSSFQQPPTDLHRYKLELQATCSFARVGMLAVVVVEFIHQQIHDLSLVMTNIDPTNLITYQGYHEHPKCVMGQMIETTDHDTCCEHLTVVAGHDNMNGCFYHITKSWIGGPAMPMM